jgi:hypothetical protein
LPAQQRSEIIYRSYRTFDIEENLDSVTSAEQVNETYQQYENEFINVLNKNRLVL